jgi:squalene-associated FAD-dependent desaturase
MPHIHVIGAGLAGLAAALTLTQAGCQVSVHEAGPVAGGRCRSYFDRELGIKVDNGNHLLLSGNRSAFDFIHEIGAEDQFPMPRHPVFPFVDLMSTERWMLRPNRGRLPWWILSKRRRIPDTRLSDYFGMARIARIRDDTVVAEAMRRGRLYWRLVEPLAVAVLNTRSGAGLARLLGAVMRETLLRGGKSYLPSFPRQGFSDALIDPAVATLRARGAEVHFGHRVSAMRWEDDRITGFRLGDTLTILGADDAIVLAVPPWVAVDLLPGLTVPDEFEAIVNLHFATEPAAAAAITEIGFVGVLEGTAEWVFLKRRHVSVTISAANRLVDEDPRELAAKVWPNVCFALGLKRGVGDALPPFRVVKERRATITATASQERRRPGAATRFRNLALAGDWTATGLPGTIEGAIRSGRTAGALLLSG